MNEWMNSLIDYWLPWGSLWAKWLRTRLWELDVLRFTDVAFFTCPSLPALLRGEELPLLLFAAKQCTYDNHLYEIQVNFYKFLSICQGNCAVRKDWQRRKVGREGGMGGKQERKGRKIFRKEGKQIPKKVFLHQCFIIFIHSIHKKSLNRWATTSKPILSPVIQSKSGAIVSFPWWL